MMQSNKINKERRKHLKKLGLGVGLFGAMALASPLINAQPHIFRDGGTDVLKMSTTGLNLYQKPLFGSDSQTRLGTTTSAPTIISMTTTQRDALTPTDGMIIYNSTTTQFEKYESSAWGAFGGGASTFLTLTDTPANFTDDAGKALVVNQGETALEFVSSVQAFNGGAFSDTFIDTVDFDAGVF